MPCRVVWSAWPERKKALARGGPRQGCRATQGGGASELFQALLPDQFPDLRRLLAAQADADLANGTASIQCAALGYASVAVTATE